MITYLLKFLGIYFACLFKFIAGPVLGAAAGYSLFEIMLVTVGGMMTTVFFLTYLGEWFRSNWAVKVSSKRKKFSPRTRKIVQIWQRFGPAGIAAITPLFLTPIGGTIVMTAFGVKKKIVFTYMFISAMAWGAFFGLTIQQILSIPFFDFLLR